MSSDISLTYYSNVSTGVWLVLSLKARQIQTPSTRKGGKFAEIATDPEPQQLQPAGETLITHNSSYRSRLSAQDKPVVKWQMRHKNQCVGSLHIKSGIYIYYFHSRYKAGDT